VALAARPRTRYPSSLSRDRSYRSDASRKRLALLRTLTAVALPAVAPALAAEIEVPALSADGGGGGCWRDLLALSSSSSTKLPSSRAASTAQNPTTLALRCGRALVKKMRSVPTEMSSPVSDERGLRFSALPDSPPPSFPSPPPPAPRVTSPNRLVS
jgi:hypothetical protein